MDNDVNINISAKDDTGAAFQSLNNQLGEVEKKTASTTEKIAGLEKQFKTLAVGGGVAFAALGYATLELAKIGATSESVAMAYTRMTEQAGIATNDLLTSLQEASAGTISQTDLMLTSNKAIALGVGQDLETMTTLMEIARVKGQNMGLTTTQAFNDIATGIGRGSPLILDNLGITIKLGEAQENYAKEIGKTVATMTDAEKKNALLNAVLKQGKKELEATGEVALTASEQLQQLGASMDDMQSALGEALSPALVEVAGAFAGLLKGVTDFAQKHPATVKAIALIALSITGLTAALGLGGLAFIAFTKASAAAAVALAPFSLTVGAILLPLAGLVAVIGTAVIAFSLIKDSMAESTAIFNQGSVAIEKAAAAFTTAESGISSFDETLTSLSESLVASQNELAELGKQAGDVSTQMADAVKDSEEKQKGYKLDKANAFIDQEQKIADIETDIIKTQEVVRDAERERRQAKDQYGDEQITKAQYQSSRKRANQARDEAQEKVETLQAQLASEQLALSNAGVLKATLSAELAEVERFNSLTEFEQKLETLALQEIMEQERLDKKLAQLGIEAAAIAEQQAEIQARIEETQASIVETELNASKEKISAAFAEAKAVVNAEQIKAEIRGESTKKYSKALDDIYEKEKRALELLDDSAEGLQAARTSSGSVAAGVGTSQSIGMFEGSTVGGTVDQLQEWSKSFWSSIFGESATPFGTQSVNDAIISPKGDIISTHPDDYIIATKDPQSLAGSGGVTINISGTFLSDRQASKRMAAEIMQVLGNNQRLTR